jgi:hypothetical protein
MHVRLSEVNNIHHCAIRHGHSVGCDDSDVVPPNGTVDVRYKVLRIEAR